MNSIRWFDDIGMADIAIVGGKNASLGEMRRALTPLGIRIPGGFATTADAYRDFVRGADLERVIRELLTAIDIGSRSGRTVACCPCPGNP
jgi:pyruvate,water dikinase